MAPFDVNARDMNDQTPLHLAVMSGHLEAARTLLRCRVRPNATTVAAAAAGPCSAAAAAGKSTSGSTSSGISSAVSAVNDAR